MGRETNRETPTQMGKTDKYRGERLMRGEAVGGWRGSRWYICPPGYTDSSQTIQLTAWAHMGARRHLGVWRCKEGAGGQTDAHTDIRSRRKLDFSSLTAVNFVKINVKITGSHI